MFSERLQRARARMSELDLDVLLLSVGADLAYLTGYEATPLERLTMLVVPRDGDATLVVPRLEAPRVEEHPEVFRVLAWDETADPISVVAGRAGRPRRVAIGDQTWARFVLGLQEVLEGATFISASAVTGPLRARKDDAEIAALRAAAHAVDNVAVAMRDRPFAGRTEFDVHRELVERMLDAGHQRTNFAIVGSGPNGASPHHDAGDRVIQTGDVVVCDFGGTMDGYCSDITRVFCVGEPPAELRDVYEILMAAQQAAFETARVGTTCEAVDHAARSLLTEAGLGDYFVHRTGHGIGLDAHEDPYIVAGNTEPITVGHAFSIEPGVYFPGRFGFRVEDIVVVTGQGTQRLNEGPRDLAIVG